MTGRFIFGVSAVVLRKTERPFALLRVTVQASCFALSFFYNVYFVKYIAFSAANLYNNLVC